MLALRYFFSGDFNLRLVPYAFLWLFQAMVLIALHLDVGAKSATSAIMMTGLFSLLGVGALCGNHIHNRSATERYWTQFIVGIVVLEFAWLCLIKFGLGWPPGLRIPVLVVLFAATLANMHNITRLDKLSPFSGLESHLTLVSASMPMVVALDLILIGHGLIPEGSRAALAIPTVWLIGGILVPALVIWLTGSQRAQA